MPSKLDIEISRNIEKHARRVIWLYRKDQVTPASYIKPRFPEDDKSLLEASDHTMEFPKQFSDESIVDKSKVEGGQNYPLPNVYVGSDEPVITLRHIFEVIPTRDLENVTIMQINRIRVCDEHKKYAFELLAYRGKVFIDGTEITASKASQVQGL